MDKKCGAQVQCVGGSRRKLTSLPCLSWSYASMDKLLRTACLHCLQCLCILNDYTAACTSFFLTSLCHIARTSTTEDGRCATDMGMSRRNPCICISSKSFQGIERRPMCGRGCCSRVELREHHQALKITWSARETNKSKGG